MKNNKTVSSTKKAIKYLRELSIVVVGIAITLGLNNLLTVRNEKKDMQLYLNAIKLELEANSAEIDRWITIAKREADYTRYLAEHDVKALDPDTIKYYSDFCYQMSTFPDQSDAFEMFKTSGSMRFIKDKDFLMDIWRAYGQLDFLKNHIDVFYNKNKLEEIRKEIQLEKEGEPVTVPLYDFFMSPYDHTDNLQRICEVTNEVLEKTITKIEDR